MIASAIVGLSASETVWKRAAASQRLAMQQRRLRPTTIAVIDYVTEHLNRTDGRGYDWRSTEELAEVIQVDPRSIKRAFKEAGAAGFAKRRRCGSVWQTTLPQMIALAIGVKRQLDVPQGGRKLRNKGTKKAQQGDQKIARGTKNSAGGPEIGFPQPDRGTKKADQGDQKGPNAPPLSSFPPYPPNNYPPVNSEIKSQSALSHAMNKSGFQGETTSSSEPRFDRALPLLARIDIAEASGDELSIKYAKGWDISVLRDQFCEWMALYPPPKNAQAAFLGWLRKTAEKREPPGPAAQERRLSSASLAAQWAAEDALDAELKAPLWPATGGINRGRLGKIVSSVVNKAQCGVQS